MKKWIIAAMIAVLLLSFCGCSSAVPEEEGFADSYIEGDSADEGTPAPEKEEPSAPSQPEKKPAASADPEKEPAEEKPQEQPKPNASNSPSKPQNNSSQQTPTKPSAPTPGKPVQDDRLPKVYPVFTNGGSYYYGIAKGENGTIAAIGKTYIDDEACFVETFDENMSFQNIRTLRGYKQISEILSCSDGGYLLVTESPASTLKLDRNLKTEWGALYETILAVQEIRPGNYAILTHSKQTGQLSVQVLDQTGKKLYGIHFADTKHIPASSVSALFGDDNGGFYLVLNWNGSLETSFEKIAQAYDSANGSDCLIAHFSATGSLTQATVVGSHCNEWCEEIAMDESGSFYIALATTDKNNPLFATALQNTGGGYRRILAKVARNGSIQYIAPLSGEAMAVDQVFGIEFSGDSVFVAGFSKYKDGLQNAFPCAHNESGSYEYVNYVACINSEGKVYDRRMFGGDINNQIADSLLLPNGSLVVCGSVDAHASPFSLSFPFSCNVARALFVYPELVS